MITDFMRPKPRMPSPEDRPLGASRDEATGAQNLVGTELGDFARLTGLSEDEVWERIREGELVSRNLHGRVIIYGPTENEEPAVGPLTALLPMPFEADEPSFADSHEGFLPPLPHLPQRAGATIGGPTGLTDLALMIDHLSLAKEENKEILRLSQESISQISRMSQTIVALKDETIAAREERIAELEAALAAEKAKVTRLKQEVEDLEMLTKTLGTEL